MAKNIEIKAILTDQKNTINILNHIADSGPIRIKQDDTFFNCQKGRLKLRVKNNSEGELIYYNRSDQTGPKTSDYSIVPINDFILLKDTLSASLGVRGEVKKVRTLYLIGQTRIHLDTVENLGSYLELEVVMKEDQAIIEGEKIAKEIMNQLNISTNQLIENAYIDLLR